MLKGGCGAIKVEAKLLIGFVGFFYFLVGVEAFFEVGQIASIVDWSRALTVDIVFQ